MRGVETRIQEIRHKIFTEVARMAYHTDRRRTPASGNGSAKPQCSRACPGIRWH